jgi:hypothetical protein
VASAIDEDLARLNEVSHKSGHLETERAWAVREEFDKGVILSVAQEDGNSGSENVRRSHRRHAPSKGPSHRLSFAVDRIAAGEAKIGVGWVEAEHVPALAAVFEPVMPRARL